VIAAPLTDATRKGNPNEIVWNDSRDKAFQELKKRISTPPMLRLPDVTRPFIVQTDASHIGIGAVLLQEDATGEQRPVAFASRKLQPRESNYSTIERECLAIVWESQSSMRCIWNGILPGNRPWTVIIPSSGKGAERETYALGPRSPTVSIPITGHPRKRQRGSRLSK